MDLENAPLVRLGPGGDYIRDYPSQQEVAPMAPAEMITCGDCRYFRRYQKPAALGICSRHAPQPAVIRRADAPDTICVWPEVREWDGCGDGDVKTTDYMELARSEDTAEAWRIAWVCQPPNSGTKRECAEKSMAAARREDTAEAWRAASLCQPLGSEARREARSRYTQLKGDTQ
jgi:hypothetical protein